MKNFFYTLLGAVIATSAISYSGNADAAQFWDKIFGKEQPAVITPSKPASPQAKVAPASNANILPYQSLAPIIKQVIPTVVNISTKTTIEVSAPVNPFLNDPFFKQFFNAPQMQAPQNREANSVGSGVIVNASKGYILTNNHVVKDADDIFVTLNDKRRFKAKLVGADAETDLAILKIEANNLTEITTGNSTNLEIGDFVIAIGNPFGLGQTVTHGIVSALGRNGLGIEGFEDFIQTDAPINPGNSGGPLINLKGELIGINTAIVSHNGGAVGIGFAIPIDMAKNVTASLISGVAIERGQLGINIQDLTPDLASAFSLKNNVYNGAVVAGVTKNSAGEKAGIKEGDVITKFNGISVDSASGLKNKVGMSKVGDKVKLTIIRDGKEQEIEAVVGKRLPQESAGAEAKSEIKQLKGMVLAELGTDSPYYGKVAGLIVKKLDDNSPAQLSGLQEGDIITSLNKQPLKNVAAYQKIAAEINKQKPKTLLLNIVRGNMAMFIAIE